MSMILGVQPDVPTETNERGGKQSATPYAFHFPFCRLMPFLPLRRLRNTVQRSTAKPR